MRLSEQDARTRLGSARVAVLATAGADGIPHLVPITFALEGDRIYSAVDHKPKTSTHLRRLRNIAQNPQVAVLAQEYSEDWDALWWVRVDGRAAVTSQAEEGGHPLDMLARRYDQYRERRPEGPVIVVSIERWTGWAGGSPPLAP